MEFQRLLVIYCFCLVTKLCLTLCDSMNYSPPGSPVHGIFQARILERLPGPPAGDFPYQGIKPESLASPALAGGFFTTVTPGEKQPVYQ